MRRAATAACLLLACLLPASALDGSSGAAPPPPPSAPPPTVGAPPGPTPPHPATDPAIVHTFIGGERLTFAIHWFNMRAGTAVMEVSDAGIIESRSAVRLVTTATSSPMITRFYPVNNRVESVVDAETLLPYRMTFRRREGKRKNDFDVIFQRHDKMLTVNKDGAVETLSMAPNTMDTISCLYYFRSLPKLEPGTSVILDVHHDKKNYRLEVQVEGIEKVHGPWGEVETIRVLAIMPFQGIFLNEGNIRVWLTNDNRRLPVLMKAKVVIGSVTARLVEGFPGGPRRP